MNVEIKATMIFLLCNKKKIGGFYMRQIKFIEYGSSDYEKTLELRNNNPHVKRAVFWLPYKGLLLHKTLKGHVK